MRPLLGNLCTRKHHEQPVRDLPRQTAFHGSIGGARGLTRCESSHEALRRRSACAMVGKLMKDAYPFIATAFWREDGLLVAVSMSCARTDSWAGWGLVRGFRDHSKLRHTSSMNI